MVEFRLICLFLVVSALKAEITMVLKPPGTTHTRPINSSIVLTCEITGYEQEDSEEVDFNIQWFDPTSVEITDTSGRLYVEDESDSLKKLYITQIKYVDAGEYTCRASESGQQFESSVKLDMFQDISFDEVPEIQNPKQHTDAHIKCVVSGSPFPKVSWRYKGQRIRGPRYNVTRTGLTIRNITEDDNGEYTCQAEVEAMGRLLERKIAVAVHIPPKISKEVGSSLRSMLGQSFSLSCGASGLPTPTYEFYKDENENDILSNDERIQIDPVAGTLKFETLEKDDEGSYTCRAVNDVGEDISTGELQVLIPPSISEFANVTGLKDGGVELSCISHGDPVPNVQFHKVGSSAVEEEENRFTIVSEEAGNFFLKISELKIEDAGPYQCTAKNEVGQIEKTAFLTVDYPPRFIDNDTEIYNWPNHLVNLTCKPDGHPMPELTWLKTDAELMNNATYRISYDTDSGESQLQVTLREQDQGWIFGNYICLAKNKRGVARYTIDMKRATTPEMPKSVETETTPTFIVLKLSPPENDGGMPVTGYRVEYYETDDDADDTTTAIHRPEKETDDGDVDENPDDGDVQNPDDSDVDENLDDSDVQNPDDSDVQNPDDGHVQNPDDGHVQNPDDGLVQNPDDGHVQNPDDSNVSENPDDSHVENPDGGDVNENLEQSDAASEVADVDGKETEDSQDAEDEDHEEEDANEPETRRYARAAKEIKSEDADNDTNSDEDAQDGEEAPEEAQEETSDVVDEDEDKQTSVSRNIVDSEETDIKIPNLKPDTRYKFEIRAQNAVGYGPPLEYSAKTEPQRKPDSVVVTSREDCQDPFRYEVTWNVPYAGGLPITAYEVSYRRLLADDGSGENNEYEDWAKKEVDQGASQYTLTGLSASSQYQLVIKAKNDVDWSDSGEEFTFGTCADPNATTTNRERPSTTLSTVALRKSASKQDAASGKVATASTGIVIGVVIAVFILLLVVVDISCFFVNGCGVTARLCGKKPIKKKSVEEGEKEHLSSPSRNGEKDGLQNIKLEEKEEDDHLKNAKEVDV